MIRHSCTKLEHWKASPWQLIYTALFDWTIIIAIWLIMSVTDHLVISLVGVIIIGGRLHALGGLLHDACHADISQKSIRWYFVEALAGWPVSSTIEAMRYHHLRHHRYTGTFKDPYLPPKFNDKVIPLVFLYARGLLLPLWWTFRPVVACVALVLPSLQPTYARLFLQDKSLQSLTGSKEIVNCAKADRVQLTAHAVLIAIVIIWNIPVLFTFIIPLHVAGVLNARRITKEHPPITQGKLFEQSLAHADVEKYTANLGTGWAESWFLAPHNLGLHIEHHQYPHIASQYLPLVRELMMRNTKLIN